MTTFPRCSSARRNSQPMRQRISCAAGFVVLIAAAFVGPSTTATASQTIPTAGPTAGPPAGPPAGPAAGGAVPVVAPTTAELAATTKAVAETTAATSAAATTKSTTTKPTTTKPTTIKTGTTKPGTTTRAVGTSKVPSPTKAPGASKRNASGQWSPNGRPTGAAVLFSAQPPSGDKASPSAPTDADAFKAIQADGKPLFFLIVGSDARPGEKVDRSRSDAVHLFAYNPAKKRGALIGFPRDTWVTPPGSSPRKLSGVLSTAGPDVLVQTMKNLTGLPITGYVITGFDGFTKMVDAIGGVNVKVSPSMNDKASGAQFQEGWFQMNGEAALAFSRARKTLPKGDLSRSANQEKFLLATLGKMRESTADVKSLASWVSIGRKHTVTNIKLGDWLYFAQAARSVDPGSLTSTVVPATPKTISGQSAVVVVQPAFGSLMKDLTDGTVG